MNSLFKFKVILLVTTVIVILNVSLTAIAGADLAETKVVPLSNNSEAVLIDDKKSAYALGVSLSRYMARSMKEQEELGITLDKAQLIAGVQDTFADKIKLSDQEIERILQIFENRMKTAAKDKMEKAAANNEVKGKSFRDAFAKKRGVKTSSTGLLYKIEKRGSGYAPKGSDIVVVNYKGTLIDGKEFDNSYSRGEPLSFRLDGVIPGWREGLQNVKKGGSIKIVIPPNLAYGKTNIPGIPANSTLIFDINLLDIKSASKANAKLDMSEETKVKAAANTSKKQF